MTRKWHTNYARITGGRYEARCPYCHNTGEYDTLADAVQDALKHAEVCGGPIHTA